MNQGFKEHVYIFGCAETEALIIHCVNYVINISFQLGQ